MNTRSLLARIASFTGIAVGAFAFVAVASTWTAPSATPPGNNVPAPINVGPNTDSSGNPLTQVKSDGLVMQGLLALSTLQFNPGGASNVAPGSTLTASDANGDVQWTATASCSNSPTDLTNSTVYQNTSGHKLMVVASQFDAVTGGGLGPVANVTGYIGISSSPTTHVAESFVGTSGAGISNHAAASITFVVPVGYYYEVVTNNPVGSAVWNSFQSWQMCP